MSGMKGLWLVAAAGTVPLGATSALACATLSEASRIAYSDVVADGVATCDRQRAICRLRVSNVIKDGRLGLRDVSVYRFSYDPKAQERLTRHLEESGEILMCVWPWEPEQDRFEGRFYFNRDKGRLSPRQDSARGRVAGVQAIFAPGTNPVEAAGEVSKLLGHNFPPMDQAAE